MDKGGWNHGALWYTSGTWHKKYVFCEFCVALCCQLSMLYDDCLLHCSWHVKIPKGYIKKLKNWSPCLIISSAPREQAWLWTRAWIEQPCTRTREYSSYSFMHDLLFLFIPKCSLPHQSPLRTCPLRSDMRQLWLILKQELRYPSKVIN